MHIIPASLSSWNSTRLLPLFSPVSIVSLSLTLRLRLDERVCIHCYVWNKRRRDPKFLVPSYLFLRYAYFLIMFIIRIEIYLWFFRGDPTLFAYAPASYGHPSVDLNCDNCLCFQVHRVCVHFDHHPIYDVLALLCKPRNDNHQGAKPNCCPWTFIHDIRTSCLPWIVYCTLIASLWWPFSTRDKECTLFSVDD